MYQSKKISVVMAVYAGDNPRAFDRALKSIWFDQSVKPNEIILVKDGELTFPLNQVIKKWSSILLDVLVLHKNDKNLGLTLSLNIAIKLTRFTFIARMDADDISTHTRFEEQISYLLKNPEVAVVGSYLQEFNETGNLPLIRTYPENTAAMRKIIHRSSPMCHGSVMFRRNVFDSGNYYNVKYRTSQDLALWFHLINEGFQLGNINKVLYRARLNEDFHKRRSFKKGWKEFLIYWNGIISLSGYSFKLIYPVARLFFRLMPGTFIKVIYFGKFRRLFNAN